MRVEDILNTEINSERASKICKNEGCDNTVSRPYWDKKDKYWRYHNRCGKCASNEYRYNMTTPQRTKLLVDRDNECEICRTPIAFKGNKAGAVSATHAVVDHCHESLKVRGIICGNCNIILGKANDSIPLFTSLIAYLKKH